MKKLFIAASAIALLATPALATDDVANLQINVNTRQAGELLVRNVGANALLSGGATAIGNNLSAATGTISSVPASTGGTLADVRLVTGQLNMNTEQFAKVDVRNAAIDRADLGATAVGNNANVESLHGNISDGWYNDIVPVVGSFDGGLNLQANVNTAQRAFLEVRDTSIAGTADLVSAAVGSNFSATAAKNNTVLSGQLNYQTTQVANLLIENVGIGGVSDVASQSIGNLLVLNGDATDGINLQGNLSTSQFATTSLINSNFGANISATATAVGNAATIRSGF